MDDETTKAMALMSYVLSNTTVMKLYQRGKISAREAADIFEDALQNLETNEIFAGMDQGPVLVARAMLEQSIAAIRLAPDWS